MEEAAAFTVKDVVDEEFELKKRMIEEELRKIDESYNSNYNEGILAKKIIGAAESIQELAHSFGNEEVDLSSNINSLKLIKLEKEEKTTQQNKSKILISFCSNLQNIFFSGQINSTINAVPKIKFKDEGEVFNTNSKRNTLDMAQFQRSKLNSSIRSKFESNSSEAREIKQISQPKKKIVDLDQILQKVYFHRH